MSKFPGSIKVRVEVQGQPSWVTTGVMHKDTPEKTVEFLNKRAKQQGIKATYTLATQAEYDAYRAEIRAA